MQDQWWQDKELLSHSIPAEIYKAAGPNALEAFHDVLQSIWEEERMPDDFRDALIFSLYKNKGSKSGCGNYRGISLLSIAGKIFARVILNRLIAVSEQNLPEAQCGFRYSGHHFCHASASREVYRTKHATLLCVHSPDQNR